MIDKLSTAEELRRGIVDAVREATPFILAGDRGARPRACLDRAHDLAAKLKALAEQTGLQDSREHAIRMLSVIEVLQSKVVAD